MVLVSHAHAFVFLKTRKTAGTSIEMALEALCAPPGHVVREKTPARLSRRGIIGARRVPQRRPMWLFRHTNFWRNHMGAEKLRTAMGPEIFDRYAKITAVRDPFTRCISQYRWRLAETGTDPQSLPFAEMRDGFRDFVTSGNWQDDREIVHVGGRYVIDHAVRFESMEADLKAVAEKCGLPLSVALPHTKQTGTGNGIPLGEYYDAGTIGIVRDRFSWVYDHFDYPSRPD